MRYLAGRENGKKWYWEIEPFVSGHNFEEKDVTAVVGFFKKNESILAVKNKRGWDLPGGHIEKGESIKQAIRREVLEETACEIDNLKPFLILKSSYYESASTYIVVFRGKIKNSTGFTSSNEIIQRALFPSEELVEKYWGNKRLLQKILKYLN